MDFKYHSPKGILSININRKTILACHLIKSLEQFGFNKVQIRKGLSGLAFDGRYIKLDVCKYIKKSLLIPNEHELPLSWDPMHKIELCQKDAKTCFVYNTCEIINSAMKHVKQGKNLETLISFSELCDIFYKPKIFKDMKFVAHAKNVFSTFFNDFPAVIATRVHQTPIHFWIVIIVSPNVPMGHMSMHAKN